MRVVQASVVVAVTLGCLSGSAAGSEVAAAPCVWSRGHIVSVRGFIRADVDGDRRSDRLAVIELGGLQASCRFALRAELASGRSSYVALRVGPPEPRLLALVAVERSGRADALVLRDTGASAAFFDLYGLRRGQLVRFGAAGGSGASRWAMAVDCWRGAHSGAIVSSFAEPRYPRAGWTVSRSISVLRGTRLTFLRSSVSRVASLTDLPEFHGSELYPSCTIARARR
ncbi:MAG: hypothetical protein QOH73_1332 [Gaiellaceae bacterium]|jgi:hypothetical protein|nr:hypothetical protein [Gaiellaceae bacterium]